MACCTHIVVVAVGAVLIRLLVLRHVLAESLLALRDASAVDAQHASAP